MGTVNGAPYYSYLNQLEGITNTSTTSSASGASTAATPTTTSTQNTTASSLVSSLLGGSSASGFAPEILSLLQENSSGSFDPITTLLGGTGTNDAITSQLSNLYATSAAASLTDAQEANTPATTTTGTTSASATATTIATGSPVQDLVNAQVQASEAYNQTVLQNAQTVLANNSYEADGVTPLVA